jgi:hypothetical protein
MNWELVGAVVAGCLAYDVAKGIGGAIGAWLVHAVDEALFMRRERMRGMGPKRE